MMAISYGTFPSSILKQSAIRPCTQRARMTAAERNSYDSQLVNRCNLDWKKLVTLALQSNDTLPNSRLLPCNETDCLNVHAQQAELMAHNSSIAFGFITRDGMDFLMRNLPFMIRLGSLFARFWLLFSENDSTDGTKELLTEYGRRYPQVQGDLLQGKAVLPSVELCPLKKRNCEARIRLLSQMRQLVYERALRLLDVLDAFVMIDIDFLSVDIPSFLQMFYAGRRLSAAAIAGQSMVRNSHKDCQAYDTSALVPYSERVKNAIQSYCFGKIYSAFSGFAIYFADALREASPKPSYTWWNSSNANHHMAILNQELRLNLKPTQYNSFLLVNEHRAMNLRLSSWGMRTGHPFLVDPRFRPMYQWGEPPRNGMETRSYIGWKPGLPPNNTWA